MKSTYIAAAALGLTAASSAPVQTVSLHADETVIVQFDNGTAVLEQTAPARPISKFEIYALWRAETEAVPPGAKIVPPDFISEGEGPPSPPHPSDDRLRITMRQVPGIRPGSPENTALFISNGYASIFRYRALMSAHGRSAPTDVCDVAPHMMGREDWPYALEQLDLSDLRLQAPNGAMTCQ